MSFNLNILTHLGNKNSTAEYQKKTEITEYQAKQKLKSRKFFILQRSMAQ